MGATGYVTGSSNNILIPASKLGDATAADVLSGKTFTSINGVKMTGTLKLRIVRYAFDVSVADASVRRYRMETVNGGIYYDSYTAYTSIQASFALNNAIVVGVISIEFLTVQTLFDIPSGIVSSVDNFSGIFYCSGGDEFTVSTRHSQFRLKVVEIDHKMGLITLEPEYDSSSTFWGEHSEIHTGSVIAKIMVEAVTFK